MNAVIAREIEHLSTADRIHLIDDIWSSVDVHSGLPRVELDTLIDSRYQHSMANPHQPTRSLREIAAGQGVFL